MKLSKKKLISAGHKEYAPDSFQKRITETHLTHKSTRYFINIERYTLTNTCGVYKHITYEAKVQFQNINSNAVCLNTTLFPVTNINIKEIEDMFEKLWITLGKPYYEEQC